MFETSIPHNQIQSYYTSANLFALPIKYGGFAIPALEAAASGLPVLYAKNEFDPHPDLIKDFALLVENNSSTFKEAIQKVLKDNELRSQMIKNGLEITKMINSDLMEEKEEKLYLNLLNKN